MIGGTRPTTVDFGTWPRRSPGPKHGASILHGTGEIGVFAVNNRSLSRLQVKLSKMGGRIVRHARRIIFQLAEVAVFREVFSLISVRINRLRLMPV